MPKTKEVPFQFKKYVAFHKIGYEECWFARKLTTDTLDEAVSRIIKYYETSKDSKYYEGPKVPEHCQDPKHCWNHIYVLYRKGQPFLNTKVDVYQYVQSVNGLRVDGEHPQLPPDRPMEFALTNGLPFCVDGLAWLFTDAV